MILTFPMHVLFVLGMQLLNRFVLDFIQDFLDYFCHQILQTLIFRCEGHEQKICGNIWLLYHFITSISSESTVHGRDQKMNSIFVTRFSTLAITDDELKYD